jgi:hypothetical protein
MSLVMRCVPEWREVLDCFKVLDAYLIAQPHGPTAYQFSVARQATAHKKDGAARPRHRASPVCTLKQPHFSKLRGARKESAR